MPGGHTNRHPAMKPTACPPASTSEFLYHRHSRFFALLGDGLEEWGGDELKALGATDIRPGYRGFHFQADTRALYQILYGARLFSRVLAPLIRFDCHSAKYLYRRTHELEWESLFGLEQTFAVQAVTSNSAIRHSRYAALSLKDAVVDRFRDRTGKRPNVDARNPDVAIHLYIHNNQATISLDLVGGSLHRRGYRAQSVDAPMQETLAAGIIRAADWQGRCPLIDPLCGSGTLLCEAWMEACRIPAGYLRESYVFQRLPDYDAALWRDVKAALDGRIHVPAGVRVEGSDIDPAAVAAAGANLNLLPGGEHVSLTQASFESLPGWSHAVIVANPPYGIRLGGREDAEKLVKAFGDFLKQRCADSNAYVYFGDEQLVKKLGLKPSWKKALKNGGLDGRLCRYELFAGPADQRKQD